MLTQTLRHRAAHLTCAHSSELPDGIFNLENPYMSSIVGSFQQLTTKSLICEVNLSWEVP